MDYLDQVFDKTNKNSEPKLSMLASMVIGAFIMSINPQESLAFQIDFGSIQSLYKGQLTEQE